MSFAASWWDWISSASVQVTCVFAIVVAIDRCVGKRAWPGLRLALWTVVMLELIAPPQWSTPFGFLPALTGDPAQLGAVGADVLSEAGAPGFDWRVFLAVIWAAGFVFQLGLFAQRFVALRRSMAGCYGDERVMELVRMASRRLGHTRMPRILITNDGRGAAVVGVLRPTLFLPRTLIESKDLERIEHVILHELMHVRRRDPLVSVCLRLLCAAYWFHPLVLWAERELAEARELACDAAVARVLGDEAPRYRNTLLRLAAEVHLPEHRALRGPAVAFLSRRSEVLRRLESLSREPLLSGRASSIASFAAFAVLAACCVPSAQTDPVPDELATFEPQGCMQVRFAFMQELARAQGLEP